jgi:hypothetical protein
MRLQHTKQVASGLSADTPGRMQAKAVIVPEVERLHWRIWNDKARNARRTLERVSNVMHVFQGERSHRTMVAPSSRKLWHALCEVDKYLRGQSERLVNYAKRYRAGPRVGTSVTEGTANFLVNRRMNKAQQMRWSPRAADLLLQVGVRSTTVRSGPASAICSSQHPIRPGNHHSPLDSPILNTPSQKSRAEGIHFCDMFRTICRSLSGVRSVAFQLIDVTNGILL